MLNCFQESWPSENDERLHLQIEGYHRISQGKTSSNIDGLAIYLCNYFNFEVFFSKSFSTLG